MLKYNGGTMALFLLILLAFAPAGDACALRSESALNKGLLWPAPRETGSYRVRNLATGKLLWDVDWETTRTEGKEETRVEIHEQGRGQPLRYHEPIIWEKRMVLVIAPVLCARSMQGSRWSQQGKLLSQADFHLDPRRRLFLYRDTGGGDGPEEGTFPWAPQTLPDEFLFHWIRTLEFGRTPAGEFSLLVSPTRRVRMRALVRGTEEVKTPAGTFRCYRVELSPRLGPLELLPLKSMLVPKVTLWCASDPPHFWVRYQGPVGGPGSPAALIELTSFQQASS
ncbi:MAG: hypothetical protein HYZ93_06320 [Candidatus Omnitrophica bacterium]|nr:hypothetical protein [Candidatus Omnitrophota bacterium]